MLDVFHVGKEIVQMLKIELIRFKPQDIVTASTLSPSSNNNKIDNSNSVNNLPNPLPGTPPSGSGH